jgi:YD repeat-containing protein
MSPARCARTVLAVLLILAVVVAIAVLAGPFWSGALFLLRAAPLASESGAQYFRPLHKGHVDISTGLYFREDDDFVVDNDVALAFRRTYMSGDRATRAFGVGTKHSADWFIRGNADNLTSAELILSDNGRIAFARVTPGHSIATALFRHAATPTEFYGAYLGWVGWEWVMRFADGRIAIFKACGPRPHDVCSVIEMRYPGGRSTEYVRDDSGRLTGIRSGEQAIAFEYDDGGRIVRGTESSGRKVAYEYDDRGRLRRATSVTGVVRRYDYNDLDEMTAIDEPRWMIENTFEDGHLIRQITRTPNADPYTLRFAYTVVEGKVAENDVTESDGTHTVYRFSDSHYMRSETIDARGPRPISVTYDRSDSTNTALAMTIRCLTSAGHVIRTVPTRPGYDEDMKRYVIATECRE